ncbi:MAG: glycosyltransferase family 4 protein [Cyclobacteriaceae bacterium]|nr:MAG: glycosyltransferase family 4 protein [Cyclobacteriaceae bacterium]
MILYLGNILSTHGGSVGFIETITPRLSSRYKIKAVSSVKSRPLRLLHMLITVVRHQRSCAVVLVDTFSTQAFWFAYAVGKLCRFLKIPYIPVVRGGDFVNRLTGSKAKCDFLFTHSHLNIVPSRFLEFHFNQHSYKVKYIPNFIELENYPFKLRDQVQAKILWVRAFHKIYNPVLAVEVMHQLNIPEARICMVGGDTDGTRELVEKRIAELNLTDQVTLPGRLLKDEWIKLADQYDIFLNTTTIDNMPVSVIEAMALGLPVVSTDVGGLPYLIEHGVNGVLVPSNNPGEMTKAIGELLTNPEYARQLSFNARQMVEQFDWEKVKLMWFEVLDGIVKIRN